jgi:hypothetical protein
MTNRLTKKDRYGHFYTNKANCRKVYSENGENFEGVFFKNQTLAIDGTAIEKLGKLEDLMEKYNVNEEDIERALIVKKITQNGSVYYEDEDGEGTYYLGPELYFDFETNEIVLSLEFDDEYCSKWEEIARLPILDYKKKYWLKEDKSE